MQIDITDGEIRNLNQQLHAHPADSTTECEVLNPNGAHAIAVGLNAPLNVSIKGSTGYYCAGMNKHANVEVHGSVGPGAAENMVRGNVKSLGADCIEKPMKEEHLTELTELLKQAGADATADQFKRYGSARELYQFNIDNASAY